MESHWPSLLKKIYLLYILDLFIGQHFCYEHMELKSWQFLIEKTAAR